MAKITRRDFLKTSAAGAAATGLTLGFPAILRAQAKEVVMLGIWPFTGAFADVGPLLDRGMRLATTPTSSPRAPPPHASRNQRV